jgi:hypothetical protein
MYNFIVKLFFKNETICQINHLICFHMSNSYYFNQLSYYGYSNDNDKGKI